MANTFSFMLNRLLERNGRLSYFEDGSNKDTLETFYTNGEEEYETEDDNASDEEDSGDDYHEGGGDKIEEESSQEEELDDLPDHLRDIDIETALRIRRRMTQPDGFSDYGDDDNDKDDKEEVAESQILFF
jgi:hypothetical protein